MGCSGRSDQVAKLLLKQHAACVASRQLPGELQQHLPRLQAASSRRLSVQLSCSRQPRLMSGARQAHCSRRRQSGVRHCTRQVRDVAAAMHTSLAGLVPWVQGLNPRCCLLRTVQAKAAMGVALLPISSSI